MNNQGSSSTSRATAQLSPEDRRAITLGLCEYGNAQMLTDAGRAAQNARYVGGGKSLIILAGGVKEMEDADIFGGRETRPQARQRQRQQQQQRGEQQHRGSRAGQVSGSWARTK